MNVRFYSFPKLTSFLLVLGTLGLTSCSSDPLDQKYTDAKDIQPLLDDNIKPPIDKSTLNFIVDATMTNSRNGVSSEGKTFRELMEQGIQLYSERKSAEILDSIAYKVEVERRLKDKKKQ